MFRQRIFRLGTVGASAMLALMLLGVGGATASTPRWAMSVAPNPTAVHPGNAAGYEVDIVNNGPSNISSLFLVADQSPAVYVNSSQGSCTLSPFGCTFGALNAGASIHIEVAFTTPTTGSTFTPTFQLNSNGSTFSDKGGKSHGDNLSATSVPPTDLNGSKDFTGGFTLTGNDTFSTDNGLSKKNPQYSTVTTGDLLGVTLEEGSTFPDSGTDPCTTGGVTCIGQWDDLHVDNGANHPIKLVLTILGNTVNGNPALSTFGVWHTGDGFVSMANNECSSPTNPSTIPCVLATKVGNNYQIVVWLSHNGGVRGQYG